MKIKGLVAIENHMGRRKMIVNYLEYRLLFYRNSQILEFIRGNIRLIIMGVDQQHQLDEAIDTEIDTEYETYTVPSKLFHHFADALPALGIVAAVLGVIITMCSIAEPPEVLGALIGAALVGTFTGVLLSYGLFGPIVFFLTRFADAQVKYLDVAIRS
jgi:chemotaxis protein MotA